MYRPVSEFCYRMSKRIMENQGMIFRYFSYVGNDLLQLNNSRILELDVNHAILGIDIFQPNSKSFNGMRPTHSEVTLLSNTYRIKFRKIWVRINQIILTNVLGLILNFFFFYPEEFESNTTIWFSL